jgi:processive 1,2-diacylglycerol beta-glucosyltransferase
MLLLILRMADCRVSSRRTESINGISLDATGAGIRCNNLPALAWRLDRLLDDPKRFATMQENSRRLARPNAARDIVNRVLELRK